MYRILYILFLLMLVQKSFAQHRPLYSQYIFNPIVLNPGYTGSNDALTAVAHIRKQMAKFPGSPFTQTLTVHSPIGNKKANLGMLLSHDQFGITNQTDILANFAYRIKITQKGKLALGTQAGIEIASNQWKNLQLADEGDDAFLSAVNNVIIPKLGLGLYYHTQNFYAGLSLPQMSLYNRNYSFAARNYYNSKLYYFTTGYTYDLNDNFQLKPSLLIKYIKASPLQVDINAVISYKKFLSLGSSYRTGDALIFLLEYRKDQFSLGYAYDYILNSLRNYSTGSHEVMLKYEFRYPVKAMNPRDFR